MSQPEEEVSGNHWGMLLVMGGIGFILQMATAGNYGIFRDEMYYLDCARHLAWGFVDHPPLSIALLKIITAVIGNSVYALRIVPALCCAFLVLLTGLLARRFGGTRWAMFFACLAALIAPVFLILTGFYSMNALELIFWPALFLLLAHLLTGGNPRLWLVFGAVMGLALLNKIGVAVLAIGLIPALIVSGGASYLKSKYFWMGATLAALIFLPHILWQMSNNWPTIEFMRNATEYKNVALSLPSFFVEQIMLINPILLPFWLAGLGALLLWRRLRPFRVLGILWLAALLFFGLQHGKPYYMAPAYPPLLAAAGCLLAALIEKRTVWWRAVATAIMVTGGLFVLPMAVPILPPSTLVEYLDQTGIQPKSGEVNDTGALPQYFADRFGWDNMARTVAQAYHSLPDSIRTGCAILTRNYGESGAINYFGPQYDLPRAICQHNSHYLWGPGNVTGETIIAIGFNIDDAQETYNEVRQIAVVVSPWAMWYETNRPVYLCRGLKVPWDQAWRAGKLFI